MAKATRGKGKGKATTASTKEAQHKAKDG